MAWEPPASGVFGAIKAPGVFKVFLFEPGRAVFAPEAAAILDQAAQAMRSQAGLALPVWVMPHAQVGYADELDNIALACDSGEIFRDHLTAAGGRARSDHRIRPACVRIPP